MSSSDPSSCPPWCECTPCQRQSSRALDHMNAHLHARTHVRGQNARTHTTHLLVVTVVALIDFGLCLRRRHARPRPHRGRQPHRGHPAASPTPVQGKIADGLHQIRCLKRCSSLSPSGATAPADATWRFGDATFAFKDSNLNEGDCVVIDQGIIKFSPGSLCTNISGQARGGGTYFLMVLGRV